MNRSLEKSKSKTPHPYIILMSILGLIVILTYLIPSGEFERVLNPETGKTVVNAEVFRYIEKEKPIGFFDFFGLIHDGLINAMGLGASLFILSGALLLVEESGAIKAGVHKIIDQFKGREFLVILMLLLFFTSLGAIGFGEAGFPFIPLTVSVIMELGYDRVAGVATAFLGLCIGWASGVLNLFTTGLSQQIMGLPLFSGLSFRMIGLAVFFVMSMVYLNHYCQKIKKDPTSSIVREEYLAHVQMPKEPMENVPFDARKKIILSLMATAFILQAYGALKLSWGLTQIGAMYLILAIITAVLFRFGATRACGLFTQGAARMLPVVLCISISQAMMIAMNRTKILDTVVYRISLILQGKSPFLVLILVYLLVTIFNFFVLSGPGKAVILIPILSPLGKLLNINQQILVLIYNYADGLTNYIYPTSGPLLAGLAMCGLGYDHWLKFVWKLILQFVVVGFLLVLLAHKIGLGPF